MKTKDDSINATNTVTSSSNKTNKLNFLFNNSVTQGIMQYRGLTNYSGKKIPYSPKSLFRFFVNPHGLDTNANWYLRINSLVRNNPKILHIYRLPELSPARFANSFNMLQHQSNCITSIDYDDDQDDLGKRQKLTSLIHSSFQYNTNQRRAYEKIIGLSSSQTFSVVALVGPAGTGKTICLKQLVQHQHLFAYVTIQNNLLQDAKLKLGLHPQKVFTLCRFIMNLFNLNFYEQCTFIHRITGNQVQNFTRLFDELPVSVEFVESLFSLQTMKMIGSTRCRKNKKVQVVTSSSKSTTLFLCIDEFSMISYSILQAVLKALEYANQCLIANGYAHKIVVILSGDCHQIQPIYTMKMNDDDNDTEEINNETLPEPLEIRYAYQYISANCRNILNLVNEKIFFIQQLRNDDNRYMQFLNHIIIADNWQLEIINHFGRRCLQNQIDLFYPIASIEALTRQMKSPYQMVEWYRQHVVQFNTFKYFTWCNVDAHYINMSVFHSIYRTFFARQQQETISCRPCLAPIYFYTNNDFHNGCYDRVRLPFLPLIPGMTYKILINKVSSLCRGQLLTLLDIDGSNGGVLTCIDRHEKIYKITPTFFTMNLFCEDSSHFLFQGIDKIATNSTHYAHMQKYGKLFGYPLQLVCGDTVRGSIGITIDSDLYINLSGCSLEEIYVILSRTRDERKIKAVYIS